MLEGDDDAHVVMRDRVASLSTVLLAVRFSEAARAQCEQAEKALVEWCGDARARVRLTIQAAQALEYLMRATETLERAIRLCAMGRS